MNIVQG